MASDDRPGMTCADALLRIRNHANMAGERLPESESLLWVLWEATRTRKPPRLEPLLHDLIACLEAINREANGPVPSETIGRVNETVLLETAYPISCIISHGLKHRREWRSATLFEEDEHATLEWAITCIAHAWSQVLAGDIDNILEDLEYNRLF